MLAALDVVAREQHVSSGRAKRSSVRIHELHPGRHQFLDVGHPDLTVGLAPPTRDVPGAHVVGQDEKDVRMRPVQVRATLRLTWLRIARRARGLIRRW